MKNERTYRIKIAIVFTGAFLLPCTGRAQQSDERLPRATVHVEVVGAFGSEITNAEIRLRSGDKTLDLTAKGSTFHNVPYGSYTLVVWDHGGGGAKRELAVNVKELWVRVGLIMPTGDRLWPGGDLSVSGAIQPVPKGKHWWIRAEGVFLHASRESPIDGRGQFSISGLEMGTYLIEVFDGSRLRHVQTIEIDTRVPDTRLNISITPDGAK